MKKIAFFSITLLLACMAGCDNKIPMEENLWPETVYLVGAKDKIINRDLNIGYEKDTIYASVAISGSLPTKEDITVTVEEFPSGIESYNQKELGSDDIKYRTLTNGIYSFPQENVIVKKGEAYGTYPVHIDPSTLHIDSLYMMAFKLSGTSRFELAKEDTVVLIRLNLMNDYSGLYYMDAIIKDVANPSDSVTYKTSRNLQAVRDGRTVRMYHMQNEWSKGATDYRPNYCFNITVNDDNTVSLSTWDKFKILGYEGVYHPDMRVYELWYKFEENGVTKTCRGFLYKERKTDDEQRIINDWMDEHRKYD